MESAIALKSCTGVVHAARRGSTQAACGVAKLNAKARMARYYKGGFTVLQTPFDQLQGERLCTNCLECLKYGYGR